MARLIPVCVLAGAAATAFADPSRSLLPPIDIHLEQPLPSNGTGSEPEVSPIGPERGEMSDPCAPRFAPGFDFPGGIRADPGSQVLAMTVFELPGEAPELMMAGGFYSLGGTPAESVGRWTGQRYVGDVIADYLDFGTAPTMTTFDDGDGEKAYFSGQQVFFRPNNPKAPIRVRRWAPGWEDFDTGPIDPSRGAINLEGFNRAGHDFLYASAFGFDGVPFAARWDGDSWESLEDPVVASDINWDFELFDDGGGQAIYATNFRVDNSDDRYVARWTGSGWETVGGAQGIFGWRLAVLQGELYLASFFGSFSNGFWKILRWTGEEWVELPVPGPITNTLIDLKTLDDGSGPSLWVTGRFERPRDNAIESAYMARWDGADWEYLGGPASDCRADPTETYMYTAREAPQEWGGGLIVAGRFRALGISDCVSLGRQAGGAAAHGLARWDGERFQQIGAGFASTITFDDRALGSVDAMAVHDDGSGSALFAGGEVQRTGTVGGGVARLRQGGWEPVGELPNTIATALRSTSVGGAPRLLAGVARTDPRGEPQESEIIAWDGAAWDPVASAIIGFVLALESTGPDIAPGGASLFAAGSFESGFDGVPRPHIARWNGVSWSDVGSGTDGPINTLEYDGASGVLYAGGEFASAGGNAATNIAAWDGAAWSALGDGLPGAVTALAMFDDGNGDLLYAGGVEGLPGEGPDRLVFVWDGQTWSSLPPNILSESVSTLVADYGISPEAPGLWAGGSAVLVTNSPALSRWDGVQWNVPDGRITHHGFNCQSCDVASIQRFDSDAGPALYFGGFFTTAYNGQTDAIGASGIVAYRSAGLAQISQQPESATTSPGFGAEFSVGADASGQAIEYQWYSNGNPLAEGPYVSGARGPELRLTEVRSDQAGQIRCELTTSCGVVVSETAVLVVIAPNECPGDTSGDGTVDFRDIYEVLVRWPTDPGPLAPARSASPGDANGDGTVGFADITFVLQNWGIDCQSEF